MDLDAPIPESLAHIVPSLVWWLDGQAFHRDHAWAFLNRAMVLASDERLAEIRGIYSDDDLRVALCPAPSIRMHGLIGIACWTSIPSLSCLAVRSLPPNRSAWIRTTSAYWPIVHSDPA